MPPGTLRAMSACQICAGPAPGLLYTGSGLEARAESFSPTNHQPGQYGDLYRCQRCGTVAQPSLPHGDALLDLYRHMRDDHYLDEEAGPPRHRPPPARRDRRHAPSGRLLDVGCGHGLLLDEARRRGYETEGLELSEHAAAARPTAPRPPPICAPDARRPRGRAGPSATTRSSSPTCSSTSTTPSPRSTTARGLLEPGGVLCLVTPDPGSRTARFAGASWWGFLPAHTFLLPREHAARAAREARPRHAGRRPARALVLAALLDGRLRRARWGGRPGGHAHAASCAATRAAVAVTWGRARDRRAARSALRRGVGAAGSSEAAAATVSSS